MKKLLLAAVAAFAITNSAHAEDKPDWSQCSTTAELDKAVQEMGGRPAAILAPDSAPDARIVLFVFKDGHYAVVVLPDVAVDKACVRETGKLVAAVPVGAPA